MVLHPTNHPKIVFVGGGLFTGGSDILFDGILAFAEGFSGLNMLAGKAVQKGRISCPYRIHGADQGICNVSPTDFEFYFGHEFPDDLQRLFGDFGIEEDGCRMCLIVGGIRTPESLPERNLSRLSGGQIKAMRQEMKNYIDSLESSVKEGSAMPNYYLPEEILRQQI